MLKKIGQRKFAARLCGGGGANTNAGSDTRLTCVSDGATVAIWHATVSKHPVS